MGEERTTLYLEPDCGAHVPHAGTCTLCGAEPRWVVDSGLNDPLYVQCNDECRPTRYTTSLFRCDSMMAHPVVLPDE